MASSPFGALKALYAEMEQAYGEHARSAGLSCEGCPTNCCTSFFQHHTYIEWIYAIKGVQALPTAKQKDVVERARAYTTHAKERLAAKAVPDAMCPLNEDGLCIIYPYRLMICRMHGTKNSIHLPNGQEQHFRGCDRFVTLPNAEEVAHLDRTPFYQRLAALEMDILRRAGRPLPGVRLTLAEMILLGPPKVR